MVERRTWVALAAVLTVLLGTGGTRVSAHDGFAWAKTGNIFLGAKKLSKDDWSPVSTQGEIGLLMDFRKQYWPLAIAVDLLYSTGDGTYDMFDFKADIAELNVGVRKRWDWHYQSCPYLGGGLAVAHASESIGTIGYSSLDGSGNAVGFWVNGGVSWKLYKVYNMGLDLRYSWAEVTLFENAVNAGGAHAGLFLGREW